MSSLETAQLINIIAKQYEFYSSVLILFFGLIGNILIIFLFTFLRLFHGNRTAFYLSVESATNIGVLLATLPSNIAEYKLNRNPVNLSLVWCKLQAMSAYCFGFYSLYVVCFLALDQYLSTNHRATWRQMSTLRLAHRLTLFNISLTVIHGILFLVFIENGPDGCTFYHPIVKMYFSFCFYPILVGILPFFVSILFSLFAYRNVRRIVRRQIPLVRRRLDQQMTAIALARVVCMVFCVVPFLVTSLIDLNINQNDLDDKGNAIYNLLLMTTSLLVYVNISVSECTLVNFIEIITWLF